MRLDYLELTNFQVLKGTRRFDFPEGIIGITGANGRGKSTIPTAIAWALYGTDAIKSGRADITTWGETPTASVTLGFTTADGESWQIDRTLSNAELYHGYDTVATGVDAVNQEVQRILSLDRVGFLTSVYARQEELAGLVSLTPANRVKTVLRLLRIEQLSTAIDRVRADAREIKNRLDGVRSVVVDTASVKKEILSIDEDMVAIDSAMEDEQERLSDLETERLSLEQSRMALIPQAKSFEIYQNEDNKAYIAIARAESAMQYAELETLRPEPPGPGDPPVHVTENELHENMAALASASNKKYETKAQIVRLEQSSVCSECGRPFDNQHDVESHLIDLTVKLEHLNKDVDSLTDSYNESKVNYQKYNAWSEDFAKYNEYQITREKAAAAYQNALEAFENARRHRDSIEPAEDVSAALQRVTSSLLETTSAAGQIRETLATLAERRTSLFSAKKRLQVELEQAKDIASVAKGLEREAATVDTAANELSKVKTKMIAGVIPMLEERASMLVSDFTDGRYTDIALTPDYDILYRNEIGQYKSFEHLSGGEKDVFALALRLAISDLRAGDIGVLMLDEVMESLDNDRQEATWSAIERLTGRYNQVILITHVHAFKDRAATVISV